jgi:hypothetical protein
MPDMLVKLYALPPCDEVFTRQSAAGIEVRRALVPEKHVVIKWVRQTFGAGWASECDAAFARQPVSCFLAIMQQELVGFGCYEATCKNFFGPTGVSERCRGQGTGKALLLACLHAMRAEGYAYAIIGGVGPAEFYAKAVGAVLIDDSAPGIYQGLLTA